MTSKLVMSSKSNRLGWTKPEKNFNSICHITLSSTHKTQRVQCDSRVLNVALKEKVLSGPDLLQSLIGINVSFREHQIALSANIEAMFFKVAVSSDESRCLQFLWREDQEQRIEAYEYTWRVFRAKSS